MPQSTKSTSTFATSAGADPVTMKPLPTDLLRELQDINMKMKGKVGNLFESLPETNEEERAKVTEVNSPLFIIEYFLKALLGEEKVSEAKKAWILNQMEKVMGRVIDRVQALKKSSSENKAVVDTMDFLLADGQIPEFLKIMEKMLGNLERTTVPQSTMTTSIFATSTEADPVKLEPLSGEEKDLLRELLKINTDMRNKIGPLYEHTSEENEELRTKLGRINLPLNRNEFYLKTLLGEIKKEDPDINVTEVEKARMPKRMEKGMGRFVDGVEALKKNNADNKAVIETMDFLLADGQAPEFLKIMEKIFG